MRSQARVNKNNGLSEPTDDREAITARHRQNFVICVSRKRDEQARLAQQWKGFGSRVCPVVKSERAAGVAVFFPLMGVVVEKRDE